MGDRPGKVPEAGGQLSEVEGPPRGAGDGEPLRAVLAVLRRPALRVRGGRWWSSAGIRVAGSDDYGCGFHREKGPRVCANALTVKIDTVERRLLEAIRGKILPGVEEGR